MERLLQWDRETLIYLNNLGNQSFDGFWSVVTNIVTWIPLYVLFGLLLSRGRPNKEGRYRVLALVAVVLLIQILTFAVKEGLGRLRPNNDVAISGFLRILKEPESYSFFSGHAATSFAMTVFVVLILRKELSWVWIFFIWPFMFVYSRIYVGVHYPLDIIVGAVFGTLVAFICFFLYKRFSAPYSG